MIALYIIILLIVLIIILNFIPLYITIKYNDETVISVKYLFFKYEFDPKSEDKIDKKDKVNKEKPKNSRGKSRIRSILGRKGIDGLLNMIKEVSKLIIGVGKDLFSNIVFDYIYVNVSLSGDDAFDTALKYGRVCSAVYPFMALIENVSDIKDKNINICADFNSSDDGIEIDCRFHIMFIKLLLAISRALFSYMKIIRA